MVAELRPHRLWPNILATMMRLADYLRENPSPIDYQRRRLLDYRDLLPAQQWNAIYDNAYHGPGWRNRVGDIARSWLFERISMLPRSAAPFKTTTQYRDAVRAEMIAMFTPALIDALNSAGLQYLSHNNVIGEPLTWAPPFSLINDLELPRPDLNSISVTQVHQLAQDPLMTTAAIARNLAVSADVVVSAGAISACATNDTPADSQRPRRDAPDKSRPSSHVQPRGHDADGHRGRGRRRA